MESILNTVKEHLGPTAQYEAFNSQIMDHINGVFFDLNQMGVGPPEGFLITDETYTWDDYIAEPRKFEAVKTYMYLRVKLVFDPPANATILASMERQIEKLEWRLNHAAETIES